jgi:ribonucleotide reductase alpha subunit
MFVIKRNGNAEAMDFEKIHRRINWLVKEPYVLEHVNGTELTQRVIQGLTDNIKTSDIDIYASDLSSSLGTNNLEYLTLAGRIAINNHHKNTLNSFKDKINRLYRKKDEQGVSCPSINAHFYKYVMKHQTSIDKHIDYTRDYSIDFFGFKTLQKGYLLTDGDTIVERPQDLFMRVAIQLYLPQEVSLFKDKTIIAKIFDVYDMISQQYFTHATPTLFNSGKNNPQLSSCFLLGTEDSAEGIMKTLTDSTRISKWSGGIGIHISNWRSTGARIRGTDGSSSGIVPFLRMFNDGARAFNQGGKRNGSFAIYLEMHHPDLMQFLDLKKSHGDENLRCRDLFLALWVSDLFMKRLEKNERWSTFDPDMCPGLNDVYGEEYERLYLSYEAKGLAKSTYNIADIMEAIVESQMERGVPYVMFKDTVNKYSMQKNIGVIRSSNLCVTGDTMILTSKGYFAIKDLASAKVPVHEVWNGEQWSEATFAKTGEKKEILKIIITTSFNMVDYDKKSIIKCTPNHKFILDDETTVPAINLVCGSRLLTWYDPYRKLNVYAKVQSVERTESLEDTYCFNEPLKHRGIFNGVLLGNCSEITLYSDSKEYAVCNLASICLSKFVEDSLSDDEVKNEVKRVLNHEFPKNPIFNYKKLISVAAQIAENLNNVIDKSWNPTVETARSNFNHRPIGVGIQGLNDVFMKFRVPFESENAAVLNKKIAEAVYFGALTGSTRASKNYYKNVIKMFKSTENDDAVNEVANVTEDAPKEVKLHLYPKDVVKQYPGLKKENVAQTFKSPAEVPKDIGSYKSYNRLGANGEEAPMKSKFHWELYGLTKDDLSGICDWETLRNHINIYGVRNSTVVAYMPTASTSQVMGNTSCFEPYVTNMYKRKTLAGYYTVINKYLMNDLINTNLWDEQMKQCLLSTEGSIQNIDGIPDHIKELYKTVWDIKQKTIMNLAADRQPFIDQSQSMNLYLKNYDASVCASIMMHGWKKGLKTNSYYIRVPTAVEAQKFTVSVNLKKLLVDGQLLNNLKISNKLSDVQEEEVCLLCSS